MRLMALAALAAMVLAPPARAAEVALAVGLSLPPYVIAEDWKGMELDIVRGALAVEGHSVAPRLMALARVNKELEAGRVDAAMPTSPESGVSACYGDSHIRYRNYAITLASRKLTVDSVKDLAERSVVAFQNASLYLGEDYRAAVQINPRYREEAKQVVQPLLLYSGRIDVVVADRYIFGWYAADPEVASKADTSQALVFHPIFPPTAYHVAFRDPDLCHSFSRGLRRLRETGEYDRIIARYNRYLGNEALSLSR